MAELERLRVKISLQIRMATGNTSDQAKQQHSNKKNRSRYTRNRREPAELNGSSS